MHEQQLAAVRVTSAYPSKATPWRTRFHFAFVPMADVPMVQEAEVRVDTAGGTVDLESASLARKVWRRMTRLQKKALNMLLPSRSKIDHARDRSMRRSFFGAALFGFAGCIQAADCTAQTHPDSKRFEYLYMNGQFVSPHTSFPEGRARSNWKCRDEKTRSTFNCTFVRGGFDKFQYIFRPRR